MDGTLGRRAFLSSFLATRQQSLRRNTRLIKDRKRRTLKLCSIQRLYSRHYIIIRVSAQHSRIQVLGTSTRNKDTRVRHDLSRFPILTINLHMTPRMITIKGILFRHLSRITRNQRHNERLTTVTRRRYGRSKFCGIRLIIRFPRNISRTRLGSLNLQSLLIIRSNLSTMLRVLSKILMRQNTRVRQTSVRTINFRPKKMTKLRAFLGNRIKRTTNKSLRRSITRLTSMNRHFFRRTRVQNRITIRITTIRIRRKHTIFMTLVRVPNGNPQVSRGIYNHGKNRKSRSFFR